MGSQIRTPARLLGLVRYTLTAEDLCCRPAPATQVWYRLARLADRPVWQVAPGAATTTSTSAALVSPSAALVLCAQLRFQDLLDAGALATGCTTFCS